MNIYTILIILFIIAIMVLIIYILLKKMVKVINEQTKLYFALKLQDYDKLIEEKEQKLKSISESKIVEEVQVKDNSEEFVPNVSINVSNYQTDDFLMALKRIDRKFDYDNKAIIKYFINNIYTVSKNPDYYISLCKIRNLITEHDYEITIRNDQDKIKYLKENLGVNEDKIINSYLRKNKDFNLNEFKIFINDAIINNDPTIYVEVGTEDNYDKLYDNIKTRYNDKIFKGVKIIYQNKLYDYSIS